MASVQAFVSEYGVSAYTASKSGLLGLTRTIAIDCAPLVRCNAVLSRLHRYSYAADFREGQQERGRGATKHAPGPSASGKPGGGRCAGDVLLLSDRSAFITGQAYRVDGGIGSMDRRTAPRWRKFLQAL